MKPKPLKVCNPFSLWISPISFNREVVTGTFGPNYTVIFTDNFWNHSREYQDGTLYSCKQLYYFLDAKRKID